MSELPGSARVLESGEVYCLQTSLFKVAAKIGGRVKDLKDILPDETVNSEQLLGSVESCSQVLGIKVKRILAIPRFVTKCRITPGLADKIEQLTARKVVTTPNIRIVWKDLGNSGLKSHAECADGSPSSNAKIYNLASEDWSTGMVIEFDNVG